MTNCLPPEQPTPFPGSLTDKFPKMVSLTRNGKANFPRFNSEEFRGLGNEKGSHFWKSIWCLKGWRKVFQYYFLAFVLFFSLMKFEEKKKKLFEHFFFFTKILERKKASLIFGVVIILKVEFW